MKILGSCVSPIDSWLQVPGPSTEVLDESPTLSANSRDETSATGSLMSSSDDQFLGYVVPFDELPRFQTTNPSCRYACPVCGREFADKKDFRRHYMIHTGEKPFHCTLCPYSARQKSSLKSHIIVKHGKHILFSSQKQ